MKRAVHVLTGLLAGISALATGGPSARAEPIVVNCADEGGTCYAPNANTTITFGRNGAVKTSSGVTQIGCNNRAFGGDPLKGQVKSCSYTIDPATISWTPCADEGQRCAFNGAKIVRFGTNNWVYGTFVNGVACNPNNFGDPEPGYVKTCQFGN